MYLVLTCMPSEGYFRQCMSLLLCLCDIFQVLINSLFVEIKTKPSREQEKERWMKCVGLTKLVQCRRLSTL